MSSPPSRLILLMSSDEHHFPIEEAAAKLSLKLERLIEVTNGVHFRLGKVKGVILAKVIDYCRIHVISNNNAEALELFDQEFVRNEDEVNLLYLANAAKYLEIQSLFELCYLALIDKLRAKPLHEIVDLFLGFVSLLVSYVSGGS